MTPKQPQPLALLDSSVSRALPGMLTVRHALLIVLSCCSCCSCYLSAQAAGYGKVVSHVIIGLKTVKGTKQLKLDPTIYDSLQKERVQVSEEGGGISVVWAHMRRLHLQQRCLLVSGRCLHAYCFTTNKVCCCCDAVCCR
jgi:hypothetical protein